MKNITQCSGKMPLTQCIGGAEGHEAFPGRRHFSTYHEMNISAVQTENDGENGEKFSFFKKDDKIMMKLYQIKW